jgi:CheY-like chemotaxis protein
LEIDTAQSGTEAIKVIKESLADKTKKSFYKMILMDLNMPHMDGIETTKAIKQLIDDYKEEELYHIESDVN